MPNQIPAEAEIRVIVAENQQIAMKEANGKLLVAVLPAAESASRRWNDFSRNYISQILAIGVNGNTACLSLRFMIEGERYTYIALEIMLKQHGPRFEIELINKLFVCILPDLDSYKKFVETLGFGPAISALRKIGDIVTARAEQKDQERLRLAESEDFHLGALRAPDAYIALRRGSRYFRKSPPPVVTEAAQPFKLTAMLPSADNQYSIKFNFEVNTIFRDRTVVIIGRNGVGKTQILKAILDGLYDVEGNISKPVEDKPAITPLILTSRVLVFSSVPTDPFPRSIGAWQGIDYEYFAVNTVRLDGADTLLSALIMCLRDQNNRSFGNARDESRYDIVKLALTTLNLWEGLHLPLRSITSDAEKLYGVLEVAGHRYYPYSYFGGEQTQLRMVQQLDWEKTPVVLTSKNGVRALSSGEYAMMRFAAQAASAIEQGSLLLLDEPETHLHPNFISELMDILHSLLEATGSIAIVATHSAYVVREAPRQRVSIISLDNRNVQIDHPRMQTFGANIDMISQFVFDDTSMNHRYNKTLEDWANSTGKAIGIENVIEQYGTELNPESLSFIARHLRKKI